MTAQDYKRKIISINSIIGLKQDAIKKYKNSLPDLLTIEAYDATESSIDNLSHQVVELLADRDKLYQDAYDSGITRKQIDEARI